jgi:hypothetical protein
MGDLQAFAVRRGASAAVARRALASALICFICVSGFPGGYYPMHPGLDLSWVWGLNHYFNSRWVFGTDVNFTFGPLGFLHYPANIGHHVLAAIAFRAAVTAAFGASLWILFSDDLASLALFGAAHAVALGLGLGTEFGLSLIVALLALAALRRDSLAGLTLLAACTGPLAMIKFSIGPALLPIVAAASVCWGFRRQRRLSALVPLAAYVASTALVGWLVMRSWHAVALWLRASLELASEYSAAMSASLSFTDRWLGLAVVGVGALVALRLFAWRPALALPSALVAVPLFFAFKSGFVREDGHMRNFFGFAPAAVAISFAATRSRRSRAVVALGVAAAAALGGFAEARHGYFDRATFLRAASGSDGWHALDRALHRRDLKVSLDEDAAGALPADRVAAPIRAALDPRSVAVLPSELLSCPANGLDCAPLATLQAYSAYTPYLDSILAAQFSGDRAPATVLVHSLQNPDARSVVLDDPLLVRSLLSNYEIAATDAAAVALRKRQTARRLVERELAVAAIRPNEWLDVPAQGPWIAARLDLRLTAWGRLVKAAYRIANVQIELRRASGKVEQRRLLPATAVNGVLVEPFAGDVAELPALFEGRHPDRVVALRLTGGGLRYYQPGALLRWVAQDFEPMTSALPR